MYFAYYDESGDDGFPTYSSPLFCLTTIYFHNSVWRANFDKVRVFRKWVKDNYHLLLREEMHTKDFLLNKNPYKKLGLPDKDRISIMDKYCETIAQLEARVINVVINKTIIRKQDYNVLDQAFLCSIQRLDNDLHDPGNPDNPDNQFIIVTDYGRIGKMRKTSRRIQVSNPIPSKSKPGTTTNHPIRSLLGDPIPQESSTSYFIQISDCISYIVYMHMLLRVTNKQLTVRLPKEVNQIKISDWLNTLSPVLNIKASLKNEHGYGIVCYPKS
jgi:hypothetical protein